MRKILMAAAVISLVLATGCGRKPKGNWKIRMVTKLAVEANSR